MVEHSQQTIDESVCVGLDPYVDAFCAFLRRQHDRGEPAQTISIEGNWGSGKSMFAKRVTELLREDHIPVVEYKPWLHHDADALWVTLAESVHRELRGQMRRREYIPRMFRLWCGQQFRWGHHSPRWGRKPRRRFRLIGIALAILIVLVVLSVVPVIWLIIDKWPLLILPEYVDGGVAFVATAAAVILAISKLSPLFKRKPDDGYKSRVPPLVHRLESEFAHLINALCPKGNFADRAVIVIDDLDRCSAIGVSETFRALSALVNDHVNTTIVLAIDRDRVASALAADDERLTPFHVGVDDPDDTKKHQNAILIGHTFLEKFIDVTMRIPSFSEPHTQEMMRRAAASNSVASQKTPSQLNPPSIKRVNEAMERLDSLYDKQVVRLFDGNPRRLKLWRREVELRILMLAAIGRLNVKGIPTPDCVTVEQVARFEALAIKWPRFLRDLRTHPDLLKWLMAHAVTSGKGIPSNWGLKVPSGQSWGKQVYDRWCDRLNDEYPVQELLTKGETVTASEAGGRRALMVELDVELLLVLQDPNTSPCGSQKPPDRDIGDTEHGTQDGSQDAASPDGSADDDSGSGEAIASHENKDDAAVVSDRTLLDMAHTSRTSSVREHHAKALFNAFHSSEPGSNRAASLLAELRSLQTTYPGDAVVREILAKALLNAFHYSEPWSDRAATLLAELRSLQTTYAEDAALRELFAKALFNASHYSEPGSDRAASLLSELHLLQATYPDDAVMREGFYNEELNAAQAAVERAQASAGTNSKRYADALNRRGQVQSDLGNLADAETDTRNALAIYRDLFEGDHPDVANSLNNLAGVKEALGLADEAEPLYQQALDMNRDLFGGDHPDVARILNNLAGVKLALGRAAEAETICQQALDMTRRLFEGDHPDVARSLNNLAGVLETLGRAGEAEPLYQQALDMRRRLFGGDHPDVANSLNNIASVEWALGRAAEAETIYIEALDMRRRLFEGDHPDVANSLNNLAGVRLTLGKMREALGPAIESAEMARRCLPEGHPHRVLYEHNLARLRERLKDAE